MIQGNNTITTPRRLRKAPILRFSTDCCALGQLSITNHHTKKEIEDILAMLKKEARAKNYLWTDKEHGQKAVFVITTPAEKNLVTNLSELGFVPTFQFERRQGYPETGLLTMWCINL